MNLNVVFVSQWLLVFSVILLVTSKSVSTRATEASSPPSSTLVIGIVTAGASVEPQVAVPELSSSAPIEANNVNRSDSTASTKNAANVSVAASPSNNASVSAAGAAVSTNSKLVSALITTNITNNGKEEIKGIKTDSAALNEKSHKSKRKIDSKKQERKHSQNKNKSKTKEDKKKNKRNRSYKNKSSKNEDTVGTYYNQTINIDKGSKLPVQIFALSKEKILITNIKRSDLTGQAVTTKVPNVESIKLASAANDDNSKSSTSVTNDENSKLAKAT